MAKKEIVWTLNAQQEFQQILEFYSERNQSDTYSTKLLTDINKRIEIISYYPHIGYLTQLKNIRIFPYKDFVLSINSTTQKYIFNLYGILREILLIGLTSYSSVELDLFSRQSSFFVLNLCWYLP